MSKAKEEAEILMCEKYLKEKYGSPIVKHYSGFIILAQSESDFKSKRNQITRGRNLGFYRFKEVLQIVNSKRLNKS